MTRPTKHPKSGVYRIRVAVPGHLRDIVQRDHERRAELVETLGTKDPSEAKRRATATVAKFEGWLRAAQAEHDDSSVHLSDREVSAWCGQWLAQQEAEFRDHLPSTADQLGVDASVLEDTVRDVEAPSGPTRGGLKEAIGCARESLVPLLAAQGVMPNPESLERLASKFVRVYLDWLLDMERRHRTGRWRASVTSQDFPALDARHGTSLPLPVCSMDDLLAGWAADRGWKLNTKPIPRPLYDRLRTLERLATFLGHRDASRVSKADAVRWKADMQARALHASTIRNDLSECSAVWKWGLANDKLGNDAPNPFAGISPPKAKRKARDPRAFTDDEAAMILQAARSGTGSLRWLPWVLALTGARLGEVSQARREDVAVVDGVLALRIHDEGDELRSVKNAESRRTVPLHPALIAEGFGDYVRSLRPRSSLWPDLKAGEQFGQVSTTAGKRLSRWLAGSLGLTDPRISPAHSWRHWFITACRRVVMPHEVRSAITGHSARVDESTGYGEGMGTMVQVLATHIAKVRLPAELRASAGEP